MPVFVLRTLDPAIDPPACAALCSGNYCPADPVTREQMAVFIAGAFGLTLYGP